MQDNYARYKIEEHETLLAQKAQQTDLNTTNANVTGLEQQLMPKRYIFGHQLEKLKYALSNPLEQFTGIVFLGDSITWGYGLSTNPADYNTGRDGTLSDRRDFMVSKSWVNNFKRYIGSKYMFNANPILSNWSASPEGESIATYSRQVSLYPYGGDFTVTNTGTVYLQTSAASSGSLLGWQFNTVIESASNGEMDLTFNFTGDNFTLSFDTTGSDSMDYELFVDGVSQGVFHTAPGTGVVAGYNNQRTHTFGYVRNKQIKIATRKTAYVGYQNLRLAGIIINKTVRISNQGIIGTTAYYYKQRNMAGNTSGDGVAYDSKDNYAFVQLGTNDRIIDPSYAKGSNEFKKNLKALLDEIKVTADVILMVSNPVSNESPATYSFTQQDVRNVIYQLAKENTLDFIDNYSIFGTTDVGTITVDGLHLNETGNYVVSRNLINSLEFN